MEESNIIIAIICESLIELKEEVHENATADASVAFKMQVPIDELLRQQQDIHRAQGDMEIAIHALMLRLHVKTATPTRSIEGTARASFVVY